MNKKIKLRKYSRVLLIFLATYFLVLIVWSLIDCLIGKNNVSNRIISYNVKDSINYDVILKDNSYTLNNGFYVVTSIESIKVNFNYEFVGSNYFSSNYSYLVLLKLYSMDNEKEIWNYEEEIVPEVENNVSDVKNFVINDEVNVDIESLYLKAMDFYQLTGRDVFLNINVNIDNELKVDGYSKKVNADKDLMISLPLTKKIVYINGEDNNNNNGRVIDNYVVNKKINWCLFIMCLLFIVSLMPVTVISYISLYELIHLEEYNRKLKKIKRRYGYLINNDLNKNELKDKEVVNVGSFSDLFKKCNERHLVINMDEEIDKGKCSFYVIDKDMVYLYELIVRKNKDKSNNKNNKGT